MAGVLAAGSSGVPVTAPDETHLMSPRQRVLQKPLESAMGGCHLDGGLQRGLVVGQIRASAAHVGGDHRIRPAIGRVNVPDMG